MSVVAPHELRTKVGLVLTVRSVEPDDAVSLHEYRQIMLRSDSFKVKQADEFTDSVDDYRRKLQAARDSSGALWLVAETAGAIVGSLHFRRGAWRRLWHHGSFDISVRPTYQGQGVGPCLLQTLIDWTERQSALIAIRLGVFAANTRAIKLYAGFGFVEEGRERRAIRFADGTFDDNILMVRHRGE